MKKRGVQTRSGQKSRSRTAKKSRGRSISDVIARDESSEIRSAERVLKKEERTIEKDVHFIFGPHEFHVVTLVASLMILGFIFNSTGLLFYSALTIGVLAFAHFLKEHYRPHDFLAILGLFFLPLLLTLAVFRDVLVWLLLAIYVLSAISTVIIYHYHKKVHPLLKVMWQVTYSKIVAVTLAVLVACILPFVFPDAFFSVIELIFLYVLPVIFVFFFASKFFYLYFFDRRHILKDLQKSLRHTLIYSLVFIVLLMCIYSLFAVRFFNSWNDDFNSGLDNTLVLVLNVEKSVMKMPSDIRRLEVSKDALSFAGTLRENISSMKSAAADGGLSLSSILDDSYFTEIAQEDFAGLRYSVLEGEVADLKGEIVKKNDLLASEAAKDDFGDGTSTLDSHANVLKAYVEEEFIAYGQDTSLNDFLSNLNDPGLSYKSFDSQAYYYIFSRVPGVVGNFDFIYQSKSIFGRQISLLVKHMSIIRDLARLEINALVFNSVEKVSPSVIEYLYANRKSDLLELSGAIRYEIIAQSIAARDGNVIGTKGN